MNQTSTNLINNCKNENMENCKNNKQRVLVIGGGLAGVECSWYLANKGIEVLLLEGKSISPNPSQREYELLAELVCSNSLKSVDPYSSHGILKGEMETFGSLIIKAAYHTRVPAGEALAVDRNLFSKFITNEILNHKNITFIKEEVADPIVKMNELKCDYVVVASGPLTTTPLENWIKENITLSTSDFYFYDAVAPVVDGDTLDYTKLYWKDRYKKYADANVNADVNANENGKSEIGYLNAPLDKEQYEKFVLALIEGKKVESRDFEQLKFFEGCLPIDVMAQRGVDTLRFSCMKPVGLELISGKRPYAVVQLRRENLLGNAYNLVGFQTRLTYGEQMRIFKMIPGFENAKFLRYGSIHRNSFLFAKKVLNSDLSSIKYPQLYFAGQITGVEGYTESAASGIYVAYQIARKFRGEIGCSCWPIESAIGSLINYLMTIPTTTTPSPSNINMGLFPPLKEEEIKKEMSIEGHKGKKLAKDIKKRLIAKRAQKVINDFNYV